MPKVEAAKMRAVLFVEVDGEPYRCTLPNERMELLLPLAAALFDSGKLGLAPTVLFKFPPAADGAAACSHGVPHRWACESCDALGVGGTDGR